MTARLQDPRRTGKTPGTKHALKTIRDDLLGINEQLRDIDNYAYATLNTEPDYDMMTEQLTNMMSRIASFNAYWKEYSTINPDPLDKELGTDLVGFKFKILSLYGVLYDVELFCIAPEKYMIFDCTDGNVDRNRYSDNIFTSTEDTPLTIRDLANALRRDIEIDGIAYSYEGTE